MAADCGNSLPASSEEQLRAIIQSATDAIITIDESQRIVLFNHAAEALFRCSAGEAVGRPLDRFIPQRVRAQHGSYIRAYGETGVSTRQMGAERVLAGLRSDGTEFPMEAQISQVTVGGQKLYTVIIRDITERKRAEEARRESEARLKGIISSATDAIITIDADQTITLFNAGAEAIFGYSADEMIGQTLDRLIPEQFREAHRRHIETFGMTGVSARQMGGERVLAGLRQNGDEFPMEARISQVEIEGQKLYTVILRDITERTQAEAERERTRAEAERIAQQVQRIQSIMDAAIADLPFDELLHELLRRVQRALATDTAVILLRPLKEEEEEEEDVLITRAAVGLEETEGQVRIPISCGFAGQIAAERKALRMEEVDFASVVSPFLRKGRVHSLLGVPLLAGERLLGVLHVGSVEPRRFRDDEVELLQLVAERIALAVERAARHEAERRAREAAEAANRAKDEFLSVVSHELRTPLTPILAWSRMLRRGGVPPKGVAGAIEAIERNARSQARLVEDLLDVSRIISGKLRLDPRPVELAEVIEAAVESVRPAADARGIVLEVFGDPAAGLVLGDPVRLQQVVWNLLTNAIKFSFPGGRIELRLAGAGSQVAMTVADTGQGIRPEFLPHLFERFRQADSSTTRAQGGLGIGLAIVRTLVELHGGSVEAASPGEGQGATFTVRLPAIARQPERLDAGERRGPAATDHPDLRGLHVLIVEDDPDTAHVLAELVAGNGAEARTAASAAKALDTFGRWQVDLLLCDIGMSGEDGYSLIEKVRRQEGARATRPLPAIAVTAYARKEDHERALAAGFDAHVGKPVDPEELLATITDHAARVFSTLPEREHSLRNDLFALTMRTDLATEELAKRRAELQQQLARAQELMRRGGGPA